MYFASVSAALTMDGHGVFVWTAYAVTTVVILSLLLVPGRRQRRLLRQLAGELRRSESGPNITKEGS